MADKRRIFRSRFRCCGVRSRGIVILLALVVSGCGPEADTLTVVERLALPDSTYRALHVRPNGDYWIGSAAGVARLASDGQTLAILNAPGSPDARWVGEVPGRLVLRGGEGIVIVDVGPDTLLAHRAGFPADAEVLDPLGRYLYLLTDAGAVTAYGLDSLQAAWGWASVGGPATAATLSPEGDRFYQAVGEAESEAENEILIRDLQTGRILDRVGRDLPVRALFTSPDGALFGLEESGSGGAVFALRWRDGELREDWRRSFDDLDIDPPAILKLSPTGRLLAVLAAENESGLRIVDGETGSTVERLRGEALDVAFGANDEIYLLLPGSIHRVD